MLRRIKRQKLVCCFLFLFNFFLCVCYLNMVPPNDGPSLPDPLTEEDIAAQAIRKALGSRDANASILALPNENTAIFEPTPEHCQERGSKVYALIMIISSPGNRNARNAIRYNLKAGMDDYNVRRWESDTRLNNSLLFFTGVSSDPNVQSKVEEEAAEYGDVVIDNVLDTYLNLTVKVLRMFKWIQTNCPNVKFMLKIDDDVHLNLLKLFQYLTSVEVDPLEAENLIGGFYYRNKAPVRTVSPPFGKWYAPPDVWPSDMYPDFIGGPGYVLGSTALRRIYAASLSTPLFHLEDVFITGILGNAKLGMKLSEIPGILPGWGTLDPYVTSTCSIKEHFLIHSLKPSELKCWKDLNQKDYVCNRWPLVISTLFC